MLRSSSIIAIFIKFTIFNGYKGKKKITASDISFTAPRQGAPIDATIVAPKGDKLSYKEFNDKGDKIGDFSYGGFYAGEYELPETSNLPVAMEISPSGTDDDTKHAQKINAAYEIIKNALK